MFKTDDGGICAAVELRCLQATMARNNLFVLIDQNGRIEAERFDAPGDSSNLCPIMFTWIVWVRLQIGDREKREFRALERRLSAIPTLLSKPLF
jgi:hypothetical protein